MEPNKLKGTFSLDKISLKIVSLQMSYWDIVRWTFKTFYDLSLNLTSFLISSEAYSSSLEGGQCQHQPALISPCGSPKAAGVTLDVRGRQSVQLFYHANTGKFIFTIGMRCVTSPCTIIPRTTQSTTGNPVKRRIQPMGNQECQW